MKKNRILHALAILGLLATFTPMGPAQSASPSPTDLVASLQAQSDGKITIAYHNATGRVRFIGTDPAHPIRQLAPLAEGATPAADARHFLAAYGGLFGLRNQAQELTIMREKAADRGRAFVRFQQVYQGVPIFGGELIVQTDAARNIISASGEILPDIAISTQPAIDDASATQIALQAVSKWYGLEASALRATQPTVWVFNPLLVQPGTGTTRLVWRLEVTPVDLLPIRELVLVDAQRGSIALHFNQISTAMNRLTHTAGNGTALPGALVCNQSDDTCSSGDAHAQKAHIYARDTYNFYFDNHSRDSLDGAGLTLTSTVHYGSGYDNAFWNGVQMVYGDANGYPLADDVVAHELTHGVTQYESGLFYYYQSGAINESFSDVWGEFVDLTNGAGNDTSGVRWQMGEDITGLGTIRNMQDPTLFGDPDRMTSPNYYSASGDSTYPSHDSGGVHTNSGVNSKAVYLMTDGGTFNGQMVTGLGITKVAQIYYEVQTNLLVSASDYADLYDALYQACLNLVGTSGITSDDCQEVRDATNAVEMNQQPIADFNTDAPLCPTGQSLATTTFFDDLESGAGNWVTGALSGANRWGYDSPYGAFAHSGLHFLFADDYPAAVSDSYAALSVSIAVPAGAYLHFAHAYGFEDPDFDGGILQYSTNNGSSWNDAGTLFEVNGYDGLLSSGNPLGSRSAFISDSHGYISSRLNLSSLAGQNVRFRWRIATDSFGIDWGWWVDDVRIYTCTAPAGSAIYLPLMMNGAALAPGLTPGFWASTAGEEFYVTTDGADVDDFAIYISVFGCGNYKITHTPLEPITNNQFSYSGSFYASGTFNSATAANGSDGLNSFYIPGCGYITGGPWLWNATWQTSAQPTFRQAEVNIPDNLARVDSAYSSHLVTPLK